MGLVAGAGSISFRDRNDGILVKVRLVRVSSKPVVGSEGIPGGSRAVSLLGSLTFRLGPRRHVNGTGTKAVAPARALLVWIPPFYVSFLSLHLVEVMKLTFNPEWAPQQ